MTPTAERLYQLLPAIHRLRDAEKGEPLKALIEVIAEQVTVLEEDLAQLYDDQFIETCRPWVAPYIGDLIGYRALHGVVPAVSSPRAEIANTISYRRRKGTAAMLEQVARDITGWHARVVEFFQRLSTTQYVNHIRLGNRSIDLREWEPLARIDTPFDQSSHTIDIRRIAVGRGRYNIPNVGIFLWRLNSFASTDVQPRPLDGRRFWFSPLGIDQPLFTRPEPKTIDSGLSTRMNVPEPIERRTLAEYFGDYYGNGRSLALTVDGALVEPTMIVSCDLSDTPGGAWTQHPEEKIGVDPVLGRIAFPRHQPPPAQVRATFHYGFSAEMGGGEYDRTDSIPEIFRAADVWQVGVSASRTPVPGELFATVQEALDAWSARPAGSIGVISLMDSFSYPGDLEITMPADSQLLIVAAEWPQAIDPERGLRRVPGRFNATGCRPHLLGAITVPEAGNGGRLFLNGLLLEGALSVSAQTLAELSIAHCTLVPGQGFSREGYPLAPREPSLRATTPQLEVHIDASITGGLRLGAEATVEMTGSIVDATSRCGVALSAPDGFGPGPVLHAENCTFIGKVHTQLMELASNVIFHARLAVHDAWPAPVLCERRQTGCLRFSFVPLNARTPRRFQCQPTDQEVAARLAPQFSSLRYGEPGYAQLSARIAPELFEGADDESEMGAFHDLFEPQRIANVGVRLEEYLRFGLEAGLFFEPRLLSRPIVPNAYTYTKWVDLCGDDAPDALPGIGAGLI